MMVVRISRLRAQNTETCKLGCVLGLLTKKKGKIELFGKTCLTSNYNTLCLSFVNMQPNRLPVQTVLIKRENLLIAYLFDTEF